MGNLAQYVKAMMQKRKADWLSPLVLASAAVNPVYTYSLAEAELWAVQGGDTAVREIFAKLGFGKEETLLAAITGWNRFRRQEGIYSVESPQRRLLGMMVYEPVDFFAHVAAVSSLAADQVFASYAKILVAGFCSQSGAERTNKYMVEVQGRKKATNLNLEKGRIQLELKMHLMHKESVRKVHSKEQRDGVRSVAEDLRAVYMSKRERAKEVLELKRRLSELRIEEKDEEEAAAEMEIGRAHV